MISLYDVACRKLEDVLKNKCSVVKDSTGTPVRSSVWVNNITGNSLGEKLDFLVYYNHSTDVIKRFATVDILVYEEDTDTVYSLTALKSIDYDQLLHYYNTFYKKGSKNVH